MSEGHDDQPHRMGDSGNGPETKYILTHKRHKRHRYPKFNPWLSRSLLLCWMRISQCESLITIRDHRRQLSNEVAPEDNKGPDRASELTCTSTCWPAASTCCHLLLESSRSSLWPSKVRIQPFKGRHGEEKVYRNKVHRNRRGRKPQPK